MTVGLDIVPENSNLGVLFDTKSFKDHVIDKINKACSMLGIIRT